MFDYLQQFNSLPKDLRDKVSSDDAMSFLTELEKRYQVDLAMVVMKVMIKSLAIKNLSATFVSEFNLDPQKAENLKQEMIAKIFAPVADYVGISSASQALNLEEDIDQLIKEAGVTITNSDLVNRLKNVLKTYVKGIRQRIDTRQILAKEVSSGGLGLSQSEIDRVFKVCDLKKYQAQDKNNIDTSASHSPSRLEKIVNENERAKNDLNNKTKMSYGETAEYDLKRALASGETKRITSPTTSVDGQINKDEESSEKLEKKEEIEPVKSQLGEGKSKEQLKLQEQTEVEEELAKLEAEESAKSAKKETGEKKSVDIKAKPEIKLEEDLNIKKTNQDSKVREPLVVRKPEKSSFFKKIFTEAQKTASPGAIKLAQVATDTNNKNSVPDEKKSQPSKANLETTSKEGEGKGVSQVENKIDNKIENKVHLNDKKEVRERDSLTAVNRPQRTPTPVSSSKGPRLDDVKVVPKIMGPLEELEYLDLTNFRRLGKTPEEMTSKIFSKIKLLEKEGYDKMIAAISAWKNSPVNRMYLKIIQAAIANGKTVKEITSSQTKDNSSLSWEEIQAVINLNSRLSF